MNREAESDGKASDRDAAREADPVTEQADHSGTFENEEKGGGGSEERFECMVVTAPLTDRRETEDGEDSSGKGAEESILSLAAASAQSELFERQDLQTVMGECELPDQHSTLEGSQVGQTAHKRHTRAGVLNQGVGAQGGPQQTIKFGG